MENWKKYLNEAVPKLNPPFGAEDPVLMGYGEFAKDRPRPRRTLSIRAYDIEHGLDLLIKNLDNLTADIEGDPISKEVAEEMAKRGLQILKRKYEEVKVAEPEKTPEEIEVFKKLDQKMKMVQQRIQQINREKDQYADTLPG